ncbi:hypothetical protein GCM10022291_31710 [Postechiella marina]|uniref:Signal peptidase I n=1 Tax=Postechiella marina TaxID=943941 RepID=A0ABP8CH43_9FLAO
MKKILRLLLISLGALIVIFVALGEMNILKIYNIPTTANDPGIKANSKILVSNMVNFENGDFICYKYEDSLYGKQVRVHRLLGKTDDIIEIRDGVFFINDLNIDKNIALKHFYSIEFEAYFDLIKNEVINEETEAFKIKDRMMLTLLDKVAEENGLSDDIKMEQKFFADQAVKEKYNKNWNMDNFGPLKIPKDKCFVIGDNRHNSIDSRYIGLINESDIVGTVIKK